MITFLKDEILILKLKNIGGRKGCRWIIIHFPLSLPGTRWYFKDTKANIQAYERDGPIFKGRGILWTGEEEEGYVHFISKIILSGAF